jgi:hypothetical protein
MTAPVLPPPAATVSLSTVVVLDGDVAIDLLLMTPSRTSGSIRIAAGGDSALNICCTDLTAARRLSDATNTLVAALERGELHPAAGGHLTAVRGG